MARWIRPETRARIVARAGGRCCYCGCDLREGSHPGSDPACATLDHVRPRNRGGSNAATNLVACCARCNSRRQYTPLRAWAYAVGLERAEAATPTDLAHRDDVVGETAQRLAAEIVRRVRNETRRVLPAMMEAA